MLTHATHHANRPLPSGVSLKQLLAMQTPYQVPEGRVHKMSDTAVPIKVTGIIKDAWAEQHVPKHRTWLRDRILAILRASGRPMNTREIAQILGIATQSAAKHFREMSETGEVETRIILTSTGRVREATAI
jgi:response regulator of citrate/malate metabolism